jgi:hypothetical protein
LSPRDGEAQHLQLVPLSLEEALTSCSATAREAHASNAPAGDERLVTVSPLPIVVGTGDVTLVLGRGGITGILDKQLSRSQAQLARRVVKAGDADDCTGTGVAIDVTQMGTNNTYLLPIDDKTPSARFDDKTRARVVLGPAGADCDERVVVLRKGVAYSMRIGDVLWLLKDRYAYRLQQSTTTGQ